MGNQGGSPARIRAAISASADAAIAASPGKADRRQLTSDLAYWIFVTAVGLVDVALSWLVFHAWGLVVLGLAGMIIALSRIAWKLALLAALKRSPSPAAGPPMPRRTPRAVVADWVAAQAAMYREVRAAVHATQAPQPRSDRAQADNSPEP